MTAESFAAGLVGIVLDERYRLDALLGEGGMGAVFRAHQLAMDRRVAVKLLKPHLTRDDTALQRFAREARSTLKVESPHAVKLIDFGVTPRGDYYMVLEYIDGRTVQRELDIDGPFAPARVVHIAKQALHALAAAHRSGLVHRDIKPENIILARVGDDPDFAKLLDFGVAKVMEGAARSSNSALSLTRSGMVFGTPEFMSPEQACGQPLDGRSDLYSLAATMFAMLTGCGMYAAASPIEWLSNHARTPAPHLADGLPALAPYRELDDVLQRCFAKHREQRPQTADELAALLSTIEPTLSARTSNPTHAKTLLPGALHHSSESSYVAPLTDETPIPPKSKGLWLALGAACIAALVISALVLSMRGEHPLDTLSSPPVPVPVPLPVPVPVPASSSASPSSPPPAPVVHVTSPPPAPAPTPSPLLAQHLSAAEAAKASGNRLREIAEADAALKLDSHNLRAHLLIADGLIATGSIESGCKYLRGLGKNPTAHALAASASCPGD